MTFLNDHHLLPEVSHVKHLIREAFHGVTLEDGIGLHEGQAIDDYAGSQLRAEAKARDERDDWSRISPNLLNGAHSSLSFVDAKGMRFHLPAYMLADLAGTLTQDLIFHLTTAFPGARDRFQLLTTAQRNAVYQYLMLHLVLLPEPNFEFEYPMIEQAMTDYWS